ncbi:cupin domain-containing protein [Alkalibacillus almallahensis]|uniref:cupin domain-containing protein n=1 Tax=Alkalibacillus almallahensis TaxID=1379154 RepID=UPI001423117C|nr:cupin domain-containing protein [Alkalibacillus almallahensis]NIK12169.1 quercetin dioxygenase-like cupin family protein [Alkalibacillus almallahensis]
MSMNVDYTSPSAQYFFDMNNSTLFKEDHQNFINVAGQNQLNTLENTSLLDIFLSADHVIEPHYHQNATELVYSISGAAVISILNPFTKELLHFTVTPGQVVNIPQGWWHYIVAIDEHTHFLAIFDAPNPEVVLGSDILKFTPADIMAHTYCLNENEWEQVTEPIKPNTFIGPYQDCDQQGNVYQNYYEYNPYNQNSYPFENWC